MVVIEGSCSYFPDERPSTTAFSLPRHLNADAYQRAMDLGMRRSGRAVYRPLCAECRKCQPVRVRVDRFLPSRSQKRARNKCRGRFTQTLGKPTLDDERLELYARYQEGQHGDEGQSADPESYFRFLVETVTETVEIAWRDEAGRLKAVGVLDVTSDALSSVYFYWDPDLRDLSMGVASALEEIALCHSWGKRFYYLGYLVPGSRTMSYKANFAGTEVYDGTGWVPLGGRGLHDDRVARTLYVAEQVAIAADASRFVLERAIPIEKASKDTDDDTDEGDALNSEDSADSELSDDSGVDS
jgi:arginine-tRNA-protein transferase